MDTATLIRAARRRHRLSQRSLARRAGTSQTHVSRIERGDVSPSVATASRLLEVMGERLELAAAPGPRANQTAADRREHARLTPGERVARAAELSFALTSIASGRARR
jgi:transcriptional regulator with XRE-family HTH domain